jgi:uncharacterized protein with PIN domain
MQLQMTQTELHPRVAPPGRCPHCGEAVIAPLASEFVDSGEIRHHWACDDCGQVFSTTLTLD